MNVALPIAARRARGERKRLGAWYTPAALAEPLAAWAIRRPDDRILDPSCGDGAFLAAAADRLRRLGGGAAAHGELAGFDIDGGAARAAAERLRAAGRPDARIESADFLACDPAQRPFDAVVGNPPYIRFQLFGDSAELAAARAAEQGVVLSRLASSWASFVVHASAFLGRDGRLAFVLPEELLHAGYSAAIRRFLTERFRATTVAAFERHVFPESQERVVVLLAEGRADENGGTLRLARLADVDALGAAIEADFPAAETYAASRSAARWEFGREGPAEALLRRLTANGALVPLGAVGKAGIGYVSGANDFFVLRRSEVERRGLPAAAFVPTLTAARHVPGARVTADDVARLRDVDEPSLLWTGARADHPACVAYVAEGVAAGVAERYKCRVRTPWFVVPGVKTPDALLTYMSDFAPRFALNEAEATCSNNLLAVFLDGVPLRARRAFAAAFHSSATAFAAEIGGRRYGGGVLKLEPREADALLVPSPAALRGVAGGTDALTDVDEALRAGDHAKAVALADDFFLRGVLGLPRSEIAALADARESRRTLRLGGRAARTKTASTARRSAS